jgi:FMN reductase [NAD(P)H]
MSFFKTVENRRSVRKFSTKVVENSKVQKILKVIWMGPSTKGLQNYKVFIVDDKIKKEKLIPATYGQDYVNSSLVLVFCSDPKRIKQMGARGKNLLSIQDATIAASYAQLAAADLGLSSVWIGHFKEKQVAKILRTNLRPVAILPIGYPNEKPPPKEFQKMKDLFKRI